MSNYVKLAAEAGDQYLSSLSEAQEQLLKYTKATTSWVPAAPVTTPEFAEYFPTPREIFEANYSFASKLLKQQKAFTEKLFAAATPAS